jgi:hypothetical protein
VFKKKERARRGIDKMISRMAKAKTLKMIILLLGILFIGSVAHGQKLKFEYDCKD